MTAAFATSRWATSAWGGGTSPISALYAYATSMSDVLVAFSGAMRAQTPTQVGDALNPGTWRVARLDTDVLLPVAQVTALTPTTVSLRLMGLLPPSTVGLSVGFPNLRDAAGGLAQAPRACGFQGMTEQAYSTPEISVVTQTQGARDLLNRTSPASGQLSGTLVVRGGDYVNQDGQSLLYKLVLRRLVATPGDFWNLPTYGVGLPLKKPVPTSDLATIQASVVRQVSLEPGVQSATCVVTLSQGILSITVGVTPVAGGQSFTVNYSVPISGGGG